MKLWLLTMNDAAMEYFDYDCSHGFVVAAASEEEARELPGKMKQCGDEQPLTWGDYSRVDCVMISPVSIFKEPTVVLRDYRHG